MGNGQISVSLSWPMPKYKLRFPVKLHQGATKRVAKNDGKKHWLGDDQKVKHKTEHLQNSFNKIILNRYWCYFTDQPSMGSR